MVTVGDRIEHLRKQRNMTQASLAEKLGVAQPQVSAWERGSEPSLGALQRIAEAFPEAGLPWLLWGIGDAPAGAEEG